MIGTTTLLTGFLALLGAFNLGASSPDDLRSQWSAYKAEFGKQYDSPAEDARRFEIFAANKLEVDRFNEQESSRENHIQGLSRISDMTLEEVRSTYGHKSDLLEKLLGAKEMDYDDEFLAKFLGDEEPLPAEVDWRKEGRVTSVKNEEKCSGNWAIALAGLLEGQEKVVNNSSETIDLSIQQLIDCSGWYNCYHGGYLPTPAETLVKSGGIMSERDYPFTKKTGATCLLDKSKIVLRPKHYKILPHNDQLTMKKMVARYGPVAASVNSMVQAYYSYKGGIYSEEDCGLSDANFVLIVGYGTDPVQGEYWIAKNGWGSNWGEDGYIRFRMEGNICGVTSRAMIFTF